MALIPVKPQCDFAYPPKESDIKGMLPGKVVLLTCTGLASSHWNILQRYFIDSQCHQINHRVVTDVVETDSLTDLDYL